ncbi:hypothetical protein BDP27DRAFT_1431870 [Rhodocollybia butyracea]|uniref:Uncharacterized protein n=1 Tax=Rhodocollybia butyracea TaxID=206335 RepID=A0A9P5PB72_9AGAR|nr:hypothetical protein BDP27DRAFT_1431870 [Rhodocollybia butyracea]
MLSVAMDIRRIVPVALSLILVGGMGYRRELVHAVAADSLSVHTLIVGSLFIIPTARNADLSSAPLNGLLNLLMDSSMLSKPCP